MSGHYIKRSKNDIINSTHAYKMGVQEISFMSILDNNCAVRFTEWSNSRNYVCKIIAFVNFQENKEILILFYSMLYLE